MAGGQVEASAFVTPYIETEGSTVTRTSMVGALKFSDANYDDDSWLAVSSWFLGVAVPTAAVHNIFTVDLASAGAGIYFFNGGTNRLRTFDGTNSSLVNVGSIDAYATQAAALSLDSSATNMALYHESAGSASSDATTAYDGLLGNDDITLGGNTLTYPTWHRSFLAIPNGSIETAGIGTILSDDSERFLA